MAFDPTKYGAVKVATPNQQTTITRQPQQPGQSGGLVSNVFNALTSSERNLGKDIGRAVLGGDKFANDITNQYTDNAAKLAQLASKQTDPALKKKYADMATSMLEDGQKAGLDLKGRTPKQIVGDVLGTALDVGLAVSGLGAAKAATKGAEGFLKGAIQGVKTGAKAGAVFGGAYGATGALQDNKDAGGIIGGTLSGVAGGALFGGALGGVTGGISGALNKPKIPAVNQNKVLDKVTPAISDLTPSQRKYYLSTGQIQGQTGTSPGKLILSEKEKNFILSNSDLFNGKTAVDNYYNVANKVLEQDKYIGRYLADSGINYSKNNLKKAINISLQGVSDITVNEKRLNALKSSLADEFVNSIKGDNLVDLWSARKEFDAFLRNKLKAFSGAPTLKKEIGNTIRTTAQTFIENELGDGVYKNTMANMNQLINLNKNLIERKALNEMGKSGFKVWLKNNPGKSIILKQASSLLKLGTAFEIATSVIK